MARSQDAMRKRAEKRNRTLPEQYKADSADMRKRLEEEAAVKKQRMIEHANASIQIDTEAIGHYGPTKISQPKPNLEVDQKAAAAAAVAPSVKKEEKVKAAPIEKKEEHSSTSNTNKAAAAAPDTRNTRTYKRTNSTIHNKFGSTKIDPLAEQGSWKCPGCANHNFASRSTCNSKTCNETRPTDCLLPIQRHLQPSQSHLQPSLQRQRPPPPPNTTNTSSSNSNKRPRNNMYNNRDKGGRHDVNTSKTQSWAGQADVATLAQNRELRRKLAESPGGTGEGMEEEDIQRAKTLIARDERKKQKKQEQKDQKAERKQKHQQQQRK